MGRKRTSPDERRSVAVTILLKPAEAQNIRWAAKVSGYSASSFCRQIILTDRCYQALKERRLATPGDLTEAKEHDQAKVRAFVQQVARESVRKVGEGQGGDA